MRSAFLFLALGAAAAGAQPNGYSGGVIHNNMGSGGAAQDEEAVQAAAARSACTPQPAHPPAAEDGTRVASVAVTGLGESRSVAARSVLLVGAYLYVSGEPGLQTVNAINPEALSVTADWKGGADKLNGAAVKGSVLYVTGAEASQGLQLFDLTNPAFPKHLAVFETPDTAVSAAVTGNLLDVSLAGESQCGVATYDIVDPKAPKLLNTLELDGRQCGVVSRAGGFLYFAVKSSLLVYDVSAPAQPKRAKALRFPGLAGQTIIKDSVLYMASGRSTNPGIHLFSLSDPAAPKHLAFLPVAGLWSMSVDGDRLIVTANGNGVSVFDLSDPQHPQILSQFSTDWPGLDPGYPVSSTVRGRYAFIGSVGGGTCALGRVYSVKIP